MFGALKLLDPRALALAKALLVVSLYAIGSSALNLWQWRAAAVAKAECIAQAELLREQQHAAAEKARADAAAQIAADAVEDQRGVLQRLEQIAARGERVRTVYRNAVAALPVPTCAPGAARMDSVNALLGQP